MYFITNNKIHRFNELYRVHGLSQERNKQQHVEAKSREPLTCVILRLLLAVVLQFINHLLHFGSDLQSYKFSKGETLILKEVKLSCYGFFLTL